MSTNFWGDTLSPMVSVGHFLNKWGLVRSCPNASPPLEPTAGCVLPMCPLGLGSHPLPWPCLGVCPPAGFPSGGEGVTVTIMSPLLWMVGEKGGYDKPGQHQRAVRASRYRKWSVPSEHPLLKPKHDLQLFSSWLCQVSGCFGKASCFRVSRRLEPRARAARVLQHRWLHWWLSRCSHLPRHCCALTGCHRPGAVGKHGRLSQTKPVGLAAAGRSQAFYLCERPVDKYKKKEQPWVPCWF